MEVVDVKEGDGFVELHLKGASHTVLALIEEYAWQNGLEMAYRKDHPLLSDFHVKFFGDNVKEKLEKVLEAIKKDIESAKKTAEKIK